MIVGNMRYNAFIVLYPIGVSGELLACYEAWEGISRVRPDNRPFTASMPNKWNFAFSFTMFLEFCIPALYICVFPGLYCHMFVQRKKYYQEQKKKRSEEILHVPEQFREFTEIEGLNKLIVKNGKIEAKNVDQDLQIRHENG